MENIFWEIKGIKGESTSDQGKDQIEVLSFDHEVAMPLTHSPSNTSRSSGRAVHKDFKITKRADLSSPILNHKCCGGDDIPEMKIHVWKADTAKKPIKFLTYTFKSCIITKVHVSCASDQPTEDVYFSYKQITWEYAQQKQDEPGGSKGKASHGWDVAKNKSL
jgi:type VI secretion system secreted protein Hcp